MAAKARIQLDDEAVARTGILINPAVSQYMWRGDDGVGSVSLCRTTESDGFVPGRRSVINARKTMKMDVDQVDWKRHRVAAAFGSG